MIRSTADIAQEVRRSTAITAFQRRVYLALLNVPEGATITYKALGQLIGCRSPQAIGQALRRNPFAPDVPCHRVVRSDGTLGGYHGQRSGAMVKRKQELLDKERRAHAT